MDSGEQRKVWERGMAKSHLWSKSKLSEKNILFIDKFWPTVLVARGVLEKQIGRAAMPNIIKGCGTGRKKEKEEKRRKKHHPSEEENEKVGRQKKAGRCTVHT
jgi:hypothetical protein